MIKSLVLCILTNYLLLFPILAQDVNTVQDDSLKNKSKHFILPGIENQNSEKRVTGYAGIMTDGSQIGYYGGLRYALKDNMSLRFDMLYEGGNNFSAQPYMNGNSRIISPSLLYEYTIIGKPGSHSPFAYNRGAEGFSLYGFTGLGAQISIPGNSMRNSETIVQSPNSKNLNLIIPLGLGMQYKFENNMTIGLEIRGNFHISNGGYYDRYSNGINTYYNSSGQWGYPGVMYRQFSNGPGF